MIFGFGRGRQDEEDEDEEIEYVLFQGALNGNNPDLGANPKLVQAGLLPAKELISDALSRRAEMIRIEPKGKVAACTLFVEGVPAPPSRMAPQAALAITQMLKLLAGLDVKVRNKPQQGGIKAEFEEKEYEIRVNTQPIQGGGERLVVRAMDPKVVLEKPQELGFSEALVDKIRDVSSSKSGVVISAGPPYSGVTSVKIAIARSTDAYLYSIYCLTDLGGRDLAHVKMFLPNEGDDLTQTMRRAKREDADVLIVDPLNDSATATQALEFSEEATIVSEMTARDAAEAIARLVQYTKNPKLVAKSVRIIVSQMLIRLLCKKCRRAYRPNPKLLAKIGLPPETKVLYRPLIAGAPSDDEEEEERDFCEACQGIGYKGRTGLLEVIEMTDGMQQVVANGGDVKAIRAQAKADKAQTFQSDGLRAVMEGLTSLEELQRALRS